jgi:hypothetical protein
MARVFSDLPNLVINRRAGPVRVGSGPEYTAGGASSLVEDRAKALDFDGMASPPLR